MKGIVDLFNSIEASIKITDGSYGFVLAVKSKYEKYGRLSPSQIAALNSINQRVSTGVDGGYKPNNCLSDDEYSDYLNALFNDPTEDRKAKSIKGWYEDRGFITSSQLVTYTKLTKKNK